MKQNVLLAIGLLALLAVGAFAATARPANVVLRQAALAGSLPSARVALVRSADVNGKNPDGLTPLMLASA